MKSLLTAILLFIPFLTIGQNHFVGLKGGNSWSNVYIQNFFSDTKTITGFVGGITYDYTVNEIWYVGADLIYAQKGFAINITITDDTGIPLIDSKEPTDFRYDYISIPLKVGIHFGDKISGFMGTGIVPSYLVKSKLIHSGFEDNTEMLKKVTKFDLAILVEVGVNVNLNQRLKVFTSMTYQDSFTSLTNDNYFKDSSIKHHALTLALGFKFTLKKES